MYICIYVTMYIYAMHSYIYTCMRSDDAGIYTCVRTINTYTCMTTYVYIHMYSYIHIFTCTYFHIYLYKLYMYKYTHTVTNGPSIAAALRLAALGITLSADVALSYVFVACTGVCMSV